MKIKIYILFILLSSFAVSADELIEAITEASNDVVLSFNFSGEIDKLYVKEGDKVIAKQKLLSQDSGIEQVQLDKLKIQMENNSDLQIAKIRLKESTFKLKQIEDAAKHNATSPLELSQSKAETKIASLQISLKEKEVALIKKEYELALTRLNKKTIIAPFTGIVEQLSVEKGEIVNQGAGVIRIIKKSPLLINVATPLNIAKNIKIGDSLKILFDNKKISKNGKVININSVAEAGSETINIKIEVDNKEQRLVGEHVFVSY